MFTLINLDLKHPLPAINTALYCLPLFFTSKSCAFVIDFSLTNCHLAGITGTGLARPFDTKSRFGKNIERRLVRRDRKLFLSLRFRFVNFNLERFTKVATSSTPKSLK
jgi:hypothetical protein